MEYKKGERVKHPTIEDWGIGEVIADSNGEVVKIFFVGVGEKRIVLKHVQPTKLSDKTSHPLLDNLKINKTSSEIKFLPFSQSINYFLEQFPNGFYGSRFKKEERNYKDKAHLLAVELLGKETFASLLEKEDYTEITRRSLKTVNATNLIFPNEKMALKDGLANLEAKKEFSQALYKLLFGNSLLKDRFEAFSNVLENIDAAKWTTATYFMYVLLPEQYMFVKPRITQHSSELFGFEINYKPQLNWLTYKSVLEFSEYLFSELSELKPRDMIDVQSFMWCIAPPKHRGL